MNPSAYLVRLPLIALVVVVFVVVFGACSSFRYSQEKIDAHRKKVSVSINSFGTYDMRGATFVIDWGIVLLALKM
jgi:ABC-type multidrug transport system permease subunit